MGANRIGMAKSMDIKNSASFPLDEKVLLFDNLLNKDYALLLYGPGIDVWRFFYSFIENGIEKGEIFICIYDKVNSKLQLEVTFGEAIKSGKLLLFPIGVGYLPKEIKDLENQVKKIYSKARSDEGALRILVDFGKLITRHSYDKAMDFVKDIIAMPSKSSKSKKPISQTVMTAFNYESLEAEQMKSLIGMHKNVLISSKDGTTTLALNFQSRKKIEGNGVEIAQRDALEHFVKRHLETIVYSMLLERPMCGYDIIKTIYQRYYTSLSQGTVYSLLYSLEAKGLLSVAKSESQRSKLYVLTDQGRSIADNQIKDFIVAQKYLLESIKKD